MIVYLVVNRVNGKAYVGQTTGDFAVRIGNHLTFAKLRRKTPFHKALAKYGRDSFDFAVLEECSDQASLDSSEIKWIAHFGSYSRNGYNCTTGGQGASGVEYTQERREKIRQSQLGDRNRLKNPETARKHGLSIRGEKHPFFGKFGPAHNRFGKHHSLSEQTKARMSAYWSSPEGVARRSAMAAKRERNNLGRFA